MAPLGVPSMEKSAYAGGIGSSGPASAKEKNMMKAICVTPGRDLEVREIPRPERAAPGHVLVEMTASAINHGDKTFLKLPTAAGNPLAGNRGDVWGASGAGRVVAIGEGVPADYAGRQVAVYRSLGRTPESVGLWCETAQVPYTSCLILPGQVRALDYCGSLVNVMTAYAFLEEIVAAGHGGVVVTAGGSATGHALAALARQRKLPAIFLARSTAARAALLQSGAEHVIVMDGDWEEKLTALSAELKATAVFDGVGGESLTRIAPCLPPGSTVCCYGFLGGDAPFSLPTALIMMKNLTIRRFSNFESGTVREPERLLAALRALEPVIADPAFTTRVGRTFGYAEIAPAMAYASPAGGKAILLP
jgi:NADPH:quinone reductase-like Zn-dependent oxidoreductase